MSAVDVRHVGERWYAAVLDHFADTVSHPQYELWRDWALSSVERGAALVDKLQEEFLGPIQGRRHLDVGSGWGGTCLAAARAGAASIGVEIGEPQLRAARLLRTDAPDLDLRFESVDVMDWRQLQGLGRFDLITCESVIEHVQIPDRLLCHFRRLLTDDGILYLTVPNAFSVGQVRKDCHYDLPGISLLDPWDGETYVRAALGQLSYEVSLYYRLETYERLLDRYGFRWKLLNPVAGTPDEIEQLRGDIDRLPHDLATDRLPPSLQRKMTELLGVYAGRAQSDLAYYDQLGDPVERDQFAKALMRDYAIELWYFVAVPAAAGRVLEAPSTLESGAD